jgi:hypothetical protein
MKVFAVFIAAEDQDGLFAATTRCKDKGENPCSVAFPGGKVDKGESLHEAACREAKEEGFSFQKVEAKPFYTTTVEGKMVAWVKGYHPKQLSNYKEAHRLDNIFASASALANQNPSFKNKEAINAYYNNENN